MSRENKKSVVLQAKETLESKLRIGHKKHEDKKIGTSDQYIYSYKTYTSYLEHSCDFLKFCRESESVRSELGRKPRTLEECRKYVSEYLKDCINRNLSPYTIKLKVSALAKLYSCRSADFGVETPSRLRKDITRSRGEKVRDKHFSEKNNADMVTFCKCTGLRRAELEQIKGSDLIFKHGEPFLNVTRATKGGRPRVSPIVGSAEEVAKVIQMLQNAENNKVFSRISTNADIHGYRAEYATRIYNAVKRPLSVFRHERMIIYQNRVIDTYTTPERYPDREKYSHLYSKTKIDKRTNKPAMLPGHRDVSSCFFCRGDLSGTIYDRQALFAASEALGHNRESVVAEHYLRL